MASARKITMQRYTLNCKGFTLVELVVVMVIFVVVIIISTYAFENILKRGGQQAKSAQSEISGVLGLEMMREDIAAAGYALPWSFPNGSPLPKYSNEVTGSPVSGFEVDAMTFNDNPPDIPRAIVSGTGGTTGIAYLVIKGAALGMATMNPTSRRWNYVNYSSGNNGYLQMKNDPSTDLQAGDRVITIAPGFSAYSSSSETKQLVVDGTGNYFYSVPGGLPPKPPSSFQPVNKTQTLIAYGINNTANSTKISMPYNRIDFFVNKSVSLPVSCNPGTGVLYKAVADQAGGFGTPYPLLDCVGDMQVSYDGVDGNGNFFQYSGTAISAMNAAQIRSQIKNVRVYILAHEGKKDPSFSYPVNDTNNVMCVGPLVNGVCSASLGRPWKKSDLESTFGASWMNYRWKVYYFLVNLKNLQ